MSEIQKQNIIDINNIILNLDEESQQKLKKIAISLLDMKLIEVMPKLALSELEELDTTEKLILLREYSLSEEEREKEREEAIPFEDVLKEAGLSLDDLQI